MNTNDNIRIVERISRTALEERLRRVPLKGSDPSNPTFIYANAHISTREMHPEELNPTTFYILRQQLELQRSLRDHLLRMGIDPLHLDGAVRLRNGTQEWTLTPPIVELTQEDVHYEPSRGDLQYDSPHRITIPIINDGAHRISLARELNETVHCIVIRGVPYEHPFYAYPNSWKQVRIVDTVPPQDGKKLYRRTNNYDLYRDFGPLGFGSPRIVE